MEVAAVQASNVADSTDSEGSSTEAGQATTDVAGFSLRQAGELAAA